MAGPARTGTTHRRRPELVRGAKAPRTDEIDPSVCSVNFNANRATHARATEPAVAVGVLGEVLLVVILGVVERGRRDDLGRDDPVTLLRERLLERVTRSLGG